MRVAVATLLTLASAQQVPPHRGPAEDAEGTASATMANLGTGNCGGGKRDVPKPRGSSLRRAEMLELGTHRAASLLLRRAPSKRWQRVARRGRRVKKLLWPVRGGRLGRGYGFTREENTHIKHKGIDIKASEGAVVRAAADGIVAYSDNTVCGYGNAIIIIHPNGWVTLYAHNKKNTVQAGWKVTRGERIGFVGATGKARGAHLHFELRERGRAADPIPHMVGRR